jgi:hypothetical protein
MTNELAQMLRDANPVDEATLPDGSSPAAQRLLTSRILPAHSGPPRRRHRLVLALVAGSAVAAGGTAFAYAALTSTDVQSGLPASSAAFIGADPRCTQTDTDAFRCELARTPLHEFSADWTGAKETFVDPAGNIAGGCVSTGVTGRSWLCYVGQRAVREQTVDSTQLGQHQEGPRHG